MYGWRGVLTGALALIVMQAVVASSATSDAVGGVLGFANQLATRLIDPKVPAIPARTKAPLAPPAGATYSGTASSSGGVATTPPPSTTPPPTTTPGFVTI